LVADKVPVKEVLPPEDIKALNQDQDTAGKSDLKAARCHFRDVFQNTVSKILTAKNIKV
jgi:hypothetical protein